MLTDISGKPHFWAELILEHLYFITLADNLRRLPLVRQLARAFFPSTLAIQNKNSQFSRAQVEKYVCECLFRPLSHITAC